MSPQSKKFLKHNRPKYDVFEMACSVPAALRAMEGFDYTEGLRILQEIRPGSDVDINDPALKVCLIKDLYTAYEREYRTV